ncbi:hypothetical protein ACHAXR_004881 [Thalassiosira sp. AJA248-18]
MAEEGTPTPPRAISPAASSAPIPIPQKHPTELQTLIADKQWPAVIERTLTHPHEVGSSSHLRNDRGYTALHTLMAYNHDVSGEELVPVVEAILRAADEVDYGAAFRLGDGSEVDDESKINRNEIVEPGGGEAGRKVGSWRLLLDQNNRAQWSPLHLMFVQGGISYGKVFAMKSLLQMNENRNNKNEGDEEKRSQYQHRIMTLVDRQNRNILHHLLDSVVPSDEAFEAARFISGMEPSLLFQHDVRGKTPLAYVLERIMASPGTRRRHFMASYGNDDEGRKKNYLMLGFLVRCMERETREWEEVLDENQKVGSSVMSGEKGSMTQNNKSNSPVSSVNDDENLPNSNILQLACLLPQSVCPSDGSLLAFLSSTDAFKLEGKVRGGNESISINMAAEADDNGNLALHLFASNKSYANCKSSGESDMDNSAPQSNTEYKIMKALLDQNHDAILIPNKNDQLPLHIAMKSGRRLAIALLVMKYPEAVAVLLGEINTNMFMHVLGCISVPPAGVNGDDDSANVEDHTNCLTTMFDLVRARPDIVSLAGSRPQKSKRKKWWKMFNSLSL